MFHVKHWSFFPLEYAKNTLFFYIFFFETVSERRLFLKALRKAIHLFLFRYSQLIRVTLSRFKPIILWVQPGYANTFDHVVAHKLSTYPYVSRET